MEYRPAAGHPAREGPRAPNARLLSPAAFLQAAGAMASCGEILAILFEGKSDAAASRTPTWMTGGVESLQRSERNVRPLYGEEP
jgi:hypothetical protein